MNAHLELNFSSLKGGDRLKRLITAADVKNYALNKEKIIHVDTNTIITPSARDLASESGIKFVTQCEAQETAAEIAGKVDKGASETNNSSLLPQQTVDQALIAKIVGEVMKSLEKKNEPPQLVKEADKSGLRLVKGDTVVLEKLDTGNDRDNVKIREVLNIKESPNMATGFMELDQTTFSWEQKYDELNYIIDGTLEYIIGGRKYTGRTGDVIFIPGDTKVTFSTPDKAKYLYVTCPVKRAE